ncbi:FixH family protein [Kitasatospora gansuensis]
MVHLLAMALWLGGLTTLLLALRNGVGPRAVELFSRLAFGAVAVLVLTGVYQAWRGLGSWGALVDTEYGRLLLIKTGAVVAMVGVAWFSRGWVARLRSGPAVAPAQAAAPAKAAVADGTDPVRAAQLARQRAARDEATVRQERDGTPARAGLRRSVLVEAAVAVVVLVVTTMLTNTPPGKVAEAVAAAPGSSPAGTPAAGASVVPGKTVELKLPYDTGGRTPNAKGTATVALNPADVGLNNVRLALTDTAGQPVEVPEVELAFTLPDRDLGPLPVTLKAEGPGRWSGTGQLPLAGNWVLSVTVRSSDIDQVTEVKPLKIG